MQILHICDGNIVSPESKTAKILNTQLCTKHPNFKSYRLFILFLLRFCPVSVATLTHRSEYALFVMSFTWRYKDHSRGPPVTLFSSLYLFFDTTHLAFLSNKAFFAKTALWPMRAWHNDFLTDYNSRIRTTPFSCSGMNIACVVLRKMYQESC